MGRQKVSKSSYVAAAVALLGSEIRLGRTRKGWSQKELARRSGTSISTIAAMESGSQSVSIGTFFETAVLCGVELFEPDLPALTRAISGKRALLQALPSRVRPFPEDDVDDFS